MRKHRTPEQWQTLVDQQRASGLSAPQFCKQEKIGYASFCNWRKRLSDPSTDESSGPGGVFQVSWHCFLFKPRLSTLPFYPDSELLVQRAHSS